MQRIGFIGASGMMGHGMAKNLLAKGYPLTLTVHRNTERVADLLAAGATQAATPAAGARRPTSSSCASPARRRSKSRARRQRACWPARRRAC